VERAPQHVQHRLELGAMRAEGLALELLRQVRSARIDPEHGEDF
jgi:hypothetical protein